MWYAHFVMWASFARRDSVVARAVGSMVGKGSVGGSEIWRSRSGALRGVVACMVALATEIPSRLLAAGRAPCPAAAGGWGECGDGGDAGGAGGHLWQRSRDARAAGLHQRLAGRLTRCGTGGGLRRGALSSLPPYATVCTASPLSSLPSRCCITPALSYALPPPLLPRPSLCLIPPSCSRLTATPVSLAGG